MVLQTNVHRVIQEDSMISYDNVKRADGKGSVSDEAKTITGCTFSPQHLAAEERMCESREEKSRCNAENKAFVFNGASDELTQMLKRRRSISPDQEEERETGTGSDERQDESEQRDESPRVSHRKMNTFSHLTVQTSSNDVVDLTSDADSSGSIDVQSIISEHMPPSSTHDKAGVTAAHRTMNLSTSNGGRRSNASTNSLIAASDVNNKMNAALSMMETFERLEADRKISAMVEVQKDRVLDASRDAALNSFATDEIIHDASTKLDAAMSMMQEFQRETADRKISFMMQVQTNVDKDYKNIRSPSRIDWETGECDKAPWVGQVGLNDDIFEDDVFEDEPLEYIEAGRDKHQSNKGGLSTISCERIVVHRRLLLAACGFFLIAGVLGWGASFVHKKKTAKCTLCYDGSTPDDLHSSMVGGQTCQDFRSSIAYLPASDNQCLQGQSLAWLMCDCPSLPPLPKKPSCTLCGEGVLLKGSACNHINTFMAHISDTDYCEALKASVSKAGCSCQDEG